MFTMINIPTAEEARKESLYRSRANSILEEIAPKIAEQTSEGFYSYTHQISSSIVASCRGGVDLAMEDLRKLGYFVELRIDNGPSYEHYWDYIYIFWGENDKED